MTLTRIVFPNKSTDRIVQDLEKVIQDRGLAENVSIDRDHGRLVVKISKLGTSKLTFERSSDRKHAQFALTSEDVAWSHRMSQVEFEKQLCDIVEAAGGKVIQK